jgi:plasmid stability protein
MVSDIRMLASREATMPDILIRNVSPSVIELLKKRARDNGTSLQHEARQVLENSVKYSWPKFAEEALKYRAGSPNDPMPAADIIREEHDARDERILRTMRGEE